MEGAQDREDPVLVEMKIKCREACLVLMLETMKL